MKPRYSAAGFFLLLTLAVGPGAVRADDAWKPPGPAVGARFPSTLELLDQAGAKRSLETLQGPQGTVLVFVRSADWCPFCMRQLADVNGKLDQFKNLGWSVVSVSVDGVPEIAQFHREQSIGYTMLADSDGQVVNGLGIRDPSYRPGKKEPGIPQPVIFAIDRKMLVRAKFAERGFRVRPNLDAVLAELAKLSAST